MDYYQYDEKELRLIESSLVPFAIYQRIDKRSVAVALSQGFCEIIGVSREDAYSLVADDIFHNIHPDDLEYVSNAVANFDKYGGTLNVIYRLLRDGDYRVIHAYGRQIPKVEARLAAVWYADEGSISGKDTGRVGRFSESLLEAIGERDLFKKANYDYVTGLPGMSYFFELAQEGRKALIDQGDAVALLFMDFIGMKEFNEQYGFAEGDKLICKFSQVLIKHFSDKNCSHFAADHFAVFTKAKGLDARLQSLFEECKTIDEGKNLPIRVGVYIDEFGTAAISSAYDRARIACETGKEVATSQAYYFDYSMIETLEKHQYVMNNIDKAVEEGWIEVHYQPIVRAANGRVSEEECLARWNDPENGFMSPGDFISILRERNSIYKLDLCVVEQVLKKLKDQVAHGLFMVPQTVNLAKEDFYACDMVEEVRKRVDNAGIERAYLTLEIAESTISDDLEFMKKQVERFQDLGFSVWLDNYGSGNASPTILQKIHFDLVKIDISFIQQIEQNGSDNGMIVLSEIIRMIMALNMDTVAEGVESEEQVEFLNEIGCTKLQGTYYSKPNSLEEIYERNRKGIQIGFENPEEVDYYEALGRVNLYDLATSKNDDSSLKNYFDTLPMAIYEVGETSLSLVRANKSYREFVGLALQGVEGKSEFSYKDYKDGAWGNSIKALRHCARDGKRAIMEERTLNGGIVQLFVRRIAVNPVTGVVAVAAVVLSFIDKTSATTGLTYTHVARALSEDYINIYYVDMDNDQFIEYAADSDFGDLPMERHGEDFFNAAHKDAPAAIYPDDLEQFLNTFTKENVQKNLDKNGTFNMTYRLMIDGTPTYVNMKVLPIKTTGNHIIIGVNNVDAQMKQRAEYERIKEEQVAFARLSALSSDNICIYVVDPETNEYTEYAIEEEYAALGLSKSGKDFFKDAYTNSQWTVYAEDLDMFNDMVTKDRILEAVNSSGAFTLYYRLLMNGQPNYVSLRVGMVEEKDGPKLIVGVFNIDAQVKRDQEYARNLSAARDKANIDELTGVKNKHAYAEVERRLNDMIAADEISEFAIVVCDLNGLKFINDTYGHQAGDKFIKDGCLIICKTFAHSPVYRVGGDEFVAIVQGTDYDNIAELMQRLSDINRRNKEKGDVVIAAGMAFYKNRDKRVATVFERADARMYENKKMLKGIKD
ncbi:MAG: EAL domain-containing protein [Butyrivibrio sp.]|nr:EAL domain-containing protein [Butyrivibrio sp.]